MSNVRPIIYTIDFFRNLNKKLKDNLLPKGTLKEATNARFDGDYGAIEKRENRAKYNTASLGTTKAHGIYRYYKNSTNSAALILGINSSIKIGYDAQGVFSDLKTGLSSDIITFQTYKDWLYMVNGSQTNNMVFGLTSKTSPIYGMGIPSATTPSGSVSATDGNLLGSLKYAVSYQYDGYQEGNVSPSTAGVNVNGSHATVSLPVSADARCTGRYLYRTKSSANTLFRLATIADNTTLAYDDNVADTSLDTTIIGPTDYGRPAAYKFIQLHQDRIFLANNKTHPSWIIYSDIRSGTSYPDVFPANNYLKIAEDDGDEITFLKEDHLGQLVVSKRKSIRVINTPAASPYSWSLSDPLSDEGCIAPYSVATTPMGIVFLARFGELKKRLVLWNGSTVQVIPQLEAIEPILSQIPDTDLNKVIGHYHNGYYYLAYRDVVSGSVYPNRVLNIDIYNDWSATVDKKNVACFCSWMGGEDKGELYSATSDSTGTVYREDASNFDLLVRYKTEVDQGSFSQTGSVGTEENPSVMLTSAVANDVGARTWGSMSGPDESWASRSGYNDTWWLAGEFVDAPRKISAKALKTLFWGETKPANTDIGFYVRTGDTEAACLAATYSGIFMTFDDSDISGITAADWIQVKGKLFSRDYATVSDLVLHRNGIGDSNYLYKVSASYGSPAETTIEFIAKSGRIDLGDVNETFKRYRKRLRSVKIEYEADSASGNFDFKWYFNGSTTQAGSFNTSFTTYKTNRVYNFPLNNFCEDFMYEIYSNSDTEKLKIRKITLELGIEPYKVLRNQL